MPIVNADYKDLDHEKMAAAIGLKPKHMPMLVDSFLEESQVILGSLDSAIKAKDYAKIKSNAHSIKGSAGNLKFNEVYNMTKEMEFSAENSDVNFDYAGYLDAVKKAVSTIPN